MSRGNLKTRIVDRVRRLLPSGNTRKVDFIIAGTQKGGTTALYSQLRHHPEVCMAASKEVHFFDNELAFSNGDPDYDRYHNLFWPRSPDAVLGEATPIYMYWKPSVERIFQYRPDIRLIMILRNPIDRAYSHWNMEVSKKKETLSFHDAIHSEKARCATAAPEQHRVYSYIDRGFYVEQIERIWKYFPKEQTLILKTEDLRQNARATLDRVCQFIGVQRFDTVKNRDVHSRAYGSKMDDQDRQYLREVFKSEIHDLERLFDWDCRAWLQ